MAKAKPKATTQILLKDALARVVAEVQVPHYAQQLIVRWIAKGQLPWGQKTWDGYCWRGKSPEEMIRDLWIRPIQVHVDWEHSCASVLVTLGGARFVVYSVWVAVETLDTLLASLDNTNISTLTPSRPLTKAGRPRGEVDRWVYKHMKDHRTEISASNYVTNLFRRNPYGASKKTIGNIVGVYRKEFEATGPSTVQKAPRNSAPKLLNKVPRN